MTMNERSTTRDLKLSFTNIRGLHSKFVHCESFLQSNSPDVLALSDLDDSNNLGNFSVMGYLTWIRKDSTTHICMVSQFVWGRTFFFTGLISRKLCRFLHMLSTGFTSLHSNDLSQMIIFFNWTPHCGSHSPALLDFFLSFDASFVLQLLSLQYSHTTIKSLT